MLAVGGGAMLDAVGCRIHRPEVRFVRLPSTTLSQGDRCRREECRQFFWKKKLGRNIHVPDAVVNDFN